ncbi:hypothetical protein KIN20_031083 [Parelaphostrongylus tenuis]|uniref:Uncharacterized protein n=1 Tax=Parelaphostrongylus tenuis TaxID=148309 RepID=A0AAD5R508_PARTN|nr:hypothetical protein KIN20_031083 [Parelaphostrongylus tenuis]
MFEEIPLKNVVIHVVRKEGASLRLIVCCNDGKDPPSCIIVGGTVTGICTVTMDNKKCSDPEGKITPVPSNVTSISGTLSTTNFIMTNWSRTMWQSIINRAVRMLAMRPFGSHFLSAVGTVVGN